MKKYYICAALTAAGLATPGRPGRRSRLVRHRGPDLRRGRRRRGRHERVRRGQPQRHAQWRPDGFAVGPAGQEDLGDGWSARFQLENGFDPSTGRQADDRSLFNYGAWVGLGHDDLGELRLGRQYTVGKTYGNALEIASWKEMGMGATFKASDNYQFSNLVNYYTPEWQGWQAGIGYSFDADAQGKFRTNANNRALSLGLKYEDGPLLAVATWDQMRLAQPPQGVQRSGHCSAAGAPPMTSRC
ncbi:porin [Achromobacter xylosoxidans]